ncbi:MAG: dimethyl sulfoxide reductase anchor subunit [Planctomycetes bacterium]|nr:dimethyl sulfoxide reductase anchor subunit [Planctomycetota bacterium]
MSVLLDRLLGEQRELTAVEQFAREDDAGALPSQQTRYSRLLPAAPPRAGQQYGFEVDLDRCTGCKACVTACHALNGLDEDETWRDVGLLVGGTAANPLMQHVTTACHHCLEPACMTACPVDAFEKDPVTGIVRHLDDQCFGCQYCTFACPYDVPKYHHAKGIVRKCDMCSSRLAAGEPPACVQGCPNEAIAIRTVDRHDVLEDAEAGSFLPAAPDPHLTLPTTTFRTARALPRNMLPVDYHAVSPQKPHWPLIVMLVLTQLAVGAYLVGIVLERFLPQQTIAAFRPLHAGGALGFGLLALVVSVLHLGRPQYAFRAVIGFSHSWLSREIVAFGVFAALASLYAAGAWLAPGGRWLTWLGWSVCVTGLAGVLCSVMIYVFTRREFWSLPAVATRFLLTTVLLGVAAVWLSLMVLDVAGEPAARQIVERTGTWLCRTLMLAAAAKLAFEALIFRHLLSRRATSLKRSAALMAGPLSNSVMARFAAGVLGGLVMPAFLLFSSGDATAGPRAEMLVVAALLFAASLGGELAERYLFFAAAAPPRMPGGLRS